MIAFVWLIAVAAAQAAAGGVDAQAPAPATADVEKPAPRARWPRPTPKRSSPCGGAHSKPKRSRIISGKLRKAKILLCAKPADSDAQWIATLDNAATHIQSSPQLSPEAKAQLIGEIQAAIGSVRGVQPAPGQADIASAPVLTPAPPPMPDPIVATVRPLPPPPPPQAVALRTPVSKPRLRISCSVAGDPGGGGSCSELTASTLLTVRADADVPSNVSLRFIRDGDPRGGIALGTMRRGQVVRARLPSRVCAGVVRARVTLQTIVIEPQSRAEQIADTQGPLLLRC